MHLTPLECKVYNLEVYLHGDTHCCRTPRNRFLYRNGDWAAHRLYLNGHHLVCVRTLHSQEAEADNQMDRQKHRNDGEDDV